MKTVKGNAAAMGVKDLDGQWQSHSTKCMHNKDDCSMIDKAENLKKLRLSVKCEMSALVYSIHAIMLRDNN